MSYGHVVLSFNSTVHSSDSAFSHQALGLSVQNTLPLDSLQNLLNYYNNLFNNLFKGMPGFTFPGHHYGGWFPSLPVYQPIKISFPKPTTSPAPNDTTTPITPTPDSTTPSIWSSATGYGEVNVLSALNLATSRTLSDVPAPSGLEWGVSSVHFDDAWAAGFTGKGVVIADIDTGIDSSNRNLNTNLSRYNWNFLSNSNNIADDNGHGSFTASELVATANSANGIQGGAYDAQLMVLKALNSSGQGDEGNIINAIRYAVDHGANVINMSLGGNMPDSNLLSALQYASSHNVICCIAAGNDSSPFPDYPAAYAKNTANVIAVGASQQNGMTLNLADFSNQAGSNKAYNFVDAPGSNLQGYDQYGQVATYSGTSMATPLVAAEAAVLYQAIACANPSYQASDIVSHVVDDIVHSTTALALLGGNFTPLL